MQKCIAPVVSLFLLFGHIGSAWAAKIEVFATDVPCASGVDTGLDVSPGDRLVVSADPTDLWNSRPDVSHNAEPGAVLAYGITAVSPSTWELWWGPLVVWVTFSPLALVSMKSLPLEGGFSSTTLIALEPTTVDPSWLA